MNTSRGGYRAANTKRIETWEQLRERLFYLAELGDELAAVAAGPITTWLYREIETEAARVAEVAGSYVDEYEATTWAGPVNTGIEQDRSPR